MEFLLGGDVITEINGQSLDDPEKIMKLVRSLRVGDKVNMTLYRETETLKVEFNLPERPILPGDLPPDSLQSPSGEIKGFNYPPSNKFGKGVDYYY